MSDEIKVTNRPVRKTAAAKQELKDAVDVSEYDSITFAFHGIALEGTASPTANVRIITGMSNETEDGWVQLVAFAQVTASNTAEKLHATAPLKYIRWEVTAITGTAPAITFDISGLGRTGV